MNTTQIVEDITSKDVRRIRNSAFEIIQASQNEEEIQLLVPFIGLIKEETRDLDLGGAIHPNSRFPEYALRIIEFHRDKSECTCRLYTGDYQFNNPRKEAEKGNVLIMSEIKADWAFDFVVQCLKCCAKYDVIQREYHYIWWRWTRVTSGNQEETEA